MILDEIKTMIFIDGKPVGLIQNVQINQDMRISNPNRLIINRLIMPENKRLKNFIKKNSRIEIQFIAEDEVYASFKFSKLSIAETNVVMSAESPIPVEHVEIIAREYTYEEA